ncbi:MAG: hypothetical protein AAFR65_12770 [Pseudomonadota bacterium]
MVATNNGNSMVDRFQRRTCLEALKRKGAMTLEDVSLWTRLSITETERHLNSLVQDKLVIHQGTKFSADVVS